LPTRKLKAFIRTLRQKYPPPLFVPEFEYANGDDDAKILFLFEKPGRMTDSRNTHNGVRGSGKVSQFNPDKTAEAVKRFLKRARIDTRNVILWNVVPAWNGTRAITSNDLRLAERDVTALLKILKSLKTIILVGSKAAQLSTQIDLSKYNLGYSLHPSPLNRASRRDEWDRIPNVWRSIVSRSR